MENSYQQVKNLDGVFTVHLESVDIRPCLLVNDIIDSGWTFTIASALLRQAGCPAVYPMALAKLSTGMD
jgi:ATP-dependent DNA helicase RecQ